MFLLFLGSGDLAAMGILEDRFKVNMDVSRIHVVPTCKVSNVIPGGYGP